MIKKVKKAENGEILMEGGQKIPAGRVSGIRIVPER